MTRISLALCCLFLFNSCAAFWEVLDAASQPTQSQPQGQEQSPSSTPAKTFTQMDANSDGKLSSTEAEGTVKESFAKLDSNKDGFLTKAEVEGVQSKRTDKRPGN